MAYTDLFDALLMVIFLMKDENNSAKMHDVTGQLHQRGLLTSYADDDITFKNILDSDEYSPYIQRGYVPEETITIETEEGTITKTLEGYTTISLTEEGLKKAEELNSARYSNPQTLFTWSFMSGFDSKLEELAAMALPENWAEGDRPYGVLRAYITNTFKRLIHMQKSGYKNAIVEGSKWAAFNTGLVDRLYDPIYALFSANRKPGMQKWVFNSWCTPGNKRSGQILSRTFKTLPCKASYFEKPSDLVYDVSAGIPTLPFDHIIERIERVPLRFLRKFIPEDFEWPAADFTPDEDFYARYREALEKDDYTRLRLKDAFELSLRRAINKVGWNYRMVIPIYDTKRRRMMLLIPMSLDFVNNSKIDIALMVERAEKSGIYIGHTILTPSMAYRKARMVMAQEADWLSPKMLDAEELANVTQSAEDAELESEIIESDANASAISSAKAREEEKEERDARYGFMTQHDDDVLFRPELELNVPKVVGTIDVSNYDKSFLFNRQNESLEEQPQSAPEIPDVEQSSQNDITFEPDEKKVIKVSAFGYMPDRDYDIPGIYKENYGKPYILVGKFRYAAREFTDTGLIDDDEVLFDIRTEPNLKNTGLFKYAVNIRIADEYDFEYE